MNRRITVSALAIGVVGLVATDIGGVKNPDAYFHSYLMAYTFWVGLGLGSLGIVFIQFLTGGTWGLATRRIFEAAAATIPLMAVLFLPLLLGLQQTYAWAQPEAVAADVVLQHKAPYLNPPFFIGRTIIYLAVWFWLSVTLRRLSQRGQLKELQRFSIIGAMLLGLTVSFAGIDWLMSLDADWYSTMYPPLVAMSFLLFSLAFGIVTLITLSRSTQLRELVNPQLLNDVGSLLLAFLMLWTYMQYFEYLLIWAGNLSDEIPWYLRRVEGGWLSVIITLGVLGFAVPFWFLLFRPIKRNPLTLAAIAGLLMVMHLVDVYWLVEPPFSPAGPAPSLLDLFALVGLGGVWFATFSWQLAARPLLAPEDPRLPRALEVARDLA